MLRTAFFAYHRDADHLNFGLNLICPIFGILKDLNIILTFLSPQFQLDSEEKGKIVLCSQIKVKRKVPNIDDVRQCVLPLDHRNQST